MFVHKPKGPSLFRYEITRRSMLTETNHVHVLRFVQTMILFVLAPDVNKIKIEIHDTFLFVPRSVLFHPQPKGPYLLLK